MWLKGKRKRKPGTEQWDNRLKDDSVALGHIDVCMTQTEALCFYWKPTHFDLDNIVIDAAYLDQGMGEIKQTRRQLNGR